MPRSATRPLYALLLAGGLVALLLGWLRLDAGGNGSSERYVEAVIGRPGPINPLLANDDASRDITALVFGGLMQIADDGTPEPDLAERWEVTPDGLTYTFLLRASATWHDGHHVSAADVAFTLDRLQSPDSPAPATLAAPWSGVDVFVVDDRTVLFHLPQPSADFLTRATVGIVPEHLLRDVPPAELPRAAFNRAPVGTGPYRLRSIDDRRALLERNAGYVHGAPAIREIELRFYADREAQLRGLRSGEASAGLLDDQPDDAVQASIAARAELGATLLTRSAYTILYFNNQIPPLDDAQVRRAIVASIDRAAVLRDGGALGTEGDGVIVPGSWAYEARAGGAPENANALWTAAGWARDASGARAQGDVRLTLELVTNIDPVRQALAQSLADQLRRQGVTVNVVPLSTPELLARRLTPRNYQLALFGWEAAPDPDPYSGWHSSQISTPGQNIAVFSDPTADALLEAARQTLDIAERRELYARFSAVLRERAPSLVLVYPARLYVHPSALVGLSEGVLFTPASRFRGIERWRLR